MDARSVMEAPAVPGSAPSPAELTQAEEHPEIALLFIGVSLAVGAFFRQVLRRTRIPYTVALLLVGVGLGALDFYVNLGILGTSIRMWANINPDLVLFVFLPALLFESAFAFEFHQIKRCILQMFLLAGPGVAISTAILGVTNKFCLPYGWDWSTALLLGGLLSATDPVAVVALLRELGASKKLSTIIDGEALMNDGTAIVVFQLFLHITLGETFTAGSIITFLLRVSLGGVALGIAFAVVTLIWLRTVFNDYIIEITLTLTSAYMAFFTANEVTAMSGVLSDMTLGIMCAIFAKTAITGENEKAMHHFWEMVAYIANTLIFVLSGVVIAEQILTQASHIQGRDWGYVVVLYLFVQLSRAAVVMLLFPGLALSGYGLDWKEALVLIWSGLRGAVALTLALIVAREPQTSVITPDTQARFIFLTGGVVFLTLIVNGTTTQFLVGGLKMNKTSDIKKRILQFTRQEMYEHALTTFEEVADDEELGPADWGTVKELLHCLKQGQEQHKWGESAAALLGGAFHPHHHQGPAHSEEDGAAGAEGALSEGSSKKGLWKQRTGMLRSKARTKSAEEVREQQLQDTRLRFLSGVQASYWAMLEAGRINQAAAILLMQSVAEAMDYTVKHKQLGLWHGLQPHIRMPPLLRDLHRTLQHVLPARMLNWVTVDRLELAASMSAAFLRASRHARQQLKAFLKDSPICDQVLLESQGEEKHVKKFLEDVRLNFPEVLTNIKTKQVAAAILRELQEYVGGLEEAGLLDQKETLQLHGSVESDLKRLLRSPPMVAIPPPLEVLERQPLIGALPADVRRALCSPLREATKLSGAVLFSEGEPSDGVWLIASGIAKWASASRMAVVHEGLGLAFAHNSTVGLYETLLGIPRMSTATADTVLHCFFIDRQRVLAARDSSTAVGDFLWRESALELARMLMPELLGDISQHDLRLLLNSATSSRFLSLMHGNVLALAPREVGLLLLGSLDPAPRLDSEPPTPSGSVRLGAALSNGALAPSGQGAEAGDEKQALLGESGKYELLTAITAPARLSYIAPPGHSSSAHNILGMESSAHGGRGTIFSASAPQLPGLPLRPGSGAALTPGAGTPGQGDPQGAAEQGALVPQYYRVLSPVAKVLIVNSSASGAELAGVLKSATSTPLNRSYVLLPPSQHLAQPHDHDALLRWESPGASPAPLDLAGEGDEAVPGLGEDGLPLSLSDYENTLPPAAKLNLAERVRHAVAQDAEKKMSERAMQLSVFGSKMDLRVPQHGATVTRRAGHHGNVGPADTRQQPAPAAALAEHGLDPHASSHPLLRPGAGNGAALKEGAPHSASARDAPVEGVEEEGDDVAVVVDSPSRLFGSKR